MQYVVWVEFLYEKCLREKRESLKEDSRFLIVWDLVHAMITNKENKQIEFNPESSIYRIVIVGHMYAQQ